MQAGPADSGGLGTRVGFGRLGRFFGMGLARPNSGSGVALVRFGVRLDWECLSACRVWTASGEQGYPHRSERSVHRFHRDLQQKVGKTASDHSRQGLPVSDIHSILWSSRAGPTSCGRAFTVAFLVVSGASWR
jgi:hypothetical protein